MAHPVKFRNNSYCESLPWGGGCGTSLFETNSIVSIDSDFFVFYKRNTFIGAYRHAQKDTDHYDRAANSENSTYITLYIKNLKTNKKVLYRDDAELGDLEAISNQRYYRIYSDHLKKKVYVIGDIDSHINYFEDYRSLKTSRPNYGLQHLTIDDVLNQQLSINDFIRRYIKDTIDQEILQFKLITGFINPTDISNHDNKIAEFELELEKLDDCDVDELRLLEQEKSRKFWKNDLVYILPEYEYTESYWLSNGSVDPAWYEIFSAHDFGELTAIDFLTGFNKIRDRQNNWALSRICNKKCF